MPSVPLPPVSGSPRVGGDSDNASTSVTVCVRGGGRVGSESLRNVISYSNLST